VRSTFDSQLFLLCWLLCVVMLLHLFAVQTASVDKSGKIPNYIPILAKVDPEQFGVSICTVDGQRFNQGDTGVYFGVQSCMKPLNYAIALETRGYDKVFEHIGIEPSGHSFNEMVLDHRRVADGTGNKGLSTVVVVVVVVVRC
jgi:glutaminase